jgi:hypothetical protein
VVELLVVDGPMDEWNFLPIFMEKYSQLMPIVINYHPLSVAVTACCVNISKPIVMSKGLALFGTSSQQSRLIGVGSKLKPHPNGPTDATKVGPCRALIYVTATDLGSKVWHGMAPWHQVVECVFQQDDWLPQLAS